jgi:hypothetical protein
MLLKRLTVGSIMLIFACAVSAQDRALPEPEYLNTAYVYDAASNKLISLERQNSNPAAKSKALGFGGIKATSEVPGLKSPVRFPADQKLVFVFMAPAGLDPQSLVRIVPLTPKKDHREIVRMQSKGVMGMGGVKSEGDKDDIPFNASKYSETSVQVSPAVPLQPGEYAIGQPYSPSLFCFGIDPASSNR